MKCQKMKKYLYRGLSVFISLYLGLCSSIGSYASSSTESGVVERTYYYVEKTFDALCRYTVNGWAVISDSIIGTWDNFLSWLEDNGHSDIWEQHPHSPIRVENGVEYVDVPEEVLEVIQEYVIYNIQQTDLGYTECYLYSYNFLDPTPFVSYAQFKATKEYLKQGGNKYSVILFTQNNIYISQYLNQDQDLAFVGTTSYGGFTSVQPYVNWATLGQQQLPPAVIINGSGTVTNVTNNNWYGYNNLKNTATPNGSNKIIMSPNDSNELVYVFKTLNAYKHYNSGSPQPYYLTSDGLGTSMSNWSVGSGTINTGTLSSVNGSYNTTISNVQSGWTAEQVLALVDRIAASSGNGSSGSDSSDKDNSSLWEKIGNAIGNLIDGIVSVVASVIEKLTDAILSIIHQLIGYTDDQGVYHDGLLGKLTSLISVDFNNFLGSVFDWLPSEIVTLFTATLIFSIFFAIWKMIRG